MCNSRPCLALVFLQENQTETMEIALLRAESVWVAGVTAQHPQLEVGHNQKYFSQAPFFFFKKKSFNQPFLPAVLRLLRALLQHSEVRCEQQALVAFRLALAVVSLCWTF